MANLTEDEHQLYDRQIRLWGLESQTRLRKTAVLVIGLGGLGSEVCKNIILAGVKSVTLLDSNIVTEQDFFANVLIDRSKLGKNRAEAALDMAKELNPLVEVSTDTGSVDEKPESYFTVFDIVCATECNLNQFLHINDVCRKNHVKFFCGDVFGHYGYFFSDLLDDHVYVETIKIPSKGETKEVTEKRVSVFVPLHNTLEMDWCRKLTTRQLSRIDPAYFLIKVLMVFQEKNGRNPNPHTKIEDIEQLKELRQKFFEEVGLRPDLIPDEYFTNVFGRLGPSCSIVGGVLSQDIIKAAACKEEPLKNWFIFNRETCAGSVYTLPMKV